MDVPDLGRPETMVMDTEGGCDLDLRRRERRERGMGGEKYELKSPRVMGSGNNG
jgi:hypothetical protein